MFLDMCQKDGPPTSQVPTWAMDGEDQAEIGAVGMRGWVLGHRTLGFKAKVCMLLGNGEAGREILCLSGSLARQVGFRL